MGAACIGQLRYVDAMRHKLIVIEVASIAENEGRSSLMVVLYDELAR